MGAAAARNKAAIVSSATAHRQAVATRAAAIGLAAGNCAAIGQHAAGAENHSRAPGCAGSTAGAPHNGAGIGDE